MCLGGGPLKTILPLSTLQCKVYIDVYAMKTLSPLLTWGHGSVRGLGHIRRIHYNVFIINNYEYYGYTLYTRPPT